MGNHIQLASPAELFEPGEFEALERAANDMNRSPYMKLERRQLNNLISEFKRLDAVRDVPTTPDYGDEIIAMVPRSQVRCLCNEIRRLRTLAGQKQ